MATRTFVSGFLVMALAFCASLDAAEAPTVYRSEEGHFTFSLPAGWHQIPQSRIQKMNEPNPPAYHFACGFQKGTPKEITVPYPYVLIQIKRKPRESKESLKTYMENAEPLAAVADLAKYIREKRYLKKPELYSKQNDAFFFIRQNAGEKNILSVMVKRFCDYGYVLMHFYLGDNLDEDVSAIKMVVGSFTFEKENDPASKTK